MVRVINRDCKNTRYLLSYIECGRLAQLARAPVLHTGGRGFEPLSAHHEKTRPQAIWFFHVTCDFRWNAAVYT